LCPGCSCCVSARTVGYLRVEDELRLRGTSQRAKCSGASATSTPSPFTITFNAHIQSTIIFCRQSAIF